MKPRNLLIGIAMATAFAASAHAAILNFTTFDGTESQTDGNVTGFGDSGSNSFDTVNGWTLGSNVSLSGSPASSGIFSGLSSYTLKDMEIRVAAGSELETAAGGDFYFGYGNQGTQLALAQQFSGLTVGDSVTVTYGLSANTGMQLWVDNGTGTYSNVGALTGSNLFTVTGSGTIRVAMIANVGADSNTTLSSIQVSAVPEPSTYGLLGAGALAGVAFVRRRRKHSGKVAA